MRQLCQSARAATRQLAVAGSARKNQALLNLAQALLDQAKMLKAANRTDLPQRLDRA